MNKPETAFGNLFTNYEKCHMIDRAYWIFDRPTLAQDMGRFKAGTTVPMAHLTTLRLTIIEDPNDSRMPHEDDVNFRLRYELLDGVK